MTDKITDTNQSEKKKRKSGGAAWCSAAGTILLVLVIVICAPITLPRLFGYHIFTVISGSMEPAISIGSLVYVHETVPEEVKAQETIAFYSADHTGAIITHRVLENRTVSGEFITKGDANPREDPEPVDYGRLLGKVVLSIPVLGKISAAAATVYGKAAAACLIVLGAVLHVIAGQLESVVL